MPWLTYIPPGGAESRVLALPGRRFTLGRDEGCDLALEDRAASRIHAVLEPGPEGWTVQDVESRNGTFLNDEKVATAPLRHGDRLRIGACRLRFEDPPVVELPPVPVATKPAGRPLAWLLAGSVVLSAGLVWLLLPGRGKPAPPPAVAVAVPRVEEPPQEPLKLDLTLRAKASYDQAFDGGDQEWAAEQELLLEVKGIVLSASQGAFTGSRRTRDGSDQVQGVIESGRVASFRWQAVRSTARTMADGHEEKAREEAWDFQAEALTSVPGRPQTYVWRASPAYGAIPSLSHTLTFHPQNVTVRLVSLEWPTGMKKDAEAPAVCLLRK